MSVKAGQAQKQQPRGTLAHEVNLAESHGSRGATGPLGGGGMAWIDHYEFGRIVVDGCQKTKDLIILPDRVVRNWWRKDGHALVLKDLADVLNELPGTWSWAPAPMAACGRPRRDPATPGARRDRGDPAHQPGRAPVR
jgi:hypothetical protein